jgi:hypothetical protein
MEFSFRIQVLGRLYHLRADSRASCRDWVITLNRVKEARMQQGNVKLVGGGGHNAALSQLSPLDLLNNSASSKQGGTPRVVVVANRQRTRAVDDDEENWDQIILADGSCGGDPSDPAYSSPTRRSALGTAVAARWTKRHSSLQRFGSKLSKWARSLKKYSCVEDMQGQEQGNAVYLDRHVHPPGHDDKVVSKPQPQQVKQQPQIDLQDQGLSSWIDKETSAVRGPTTIMPQDAVGVKPSPMQDRNRSTASSDYDGRMIS